MKVTYPGPFEAVDVPALGRTVDQGESVTVTADVAAQLIAQGWTNVAPKRTNKPGRKTEED